MERERIFEVNGFEFYEVLIEIISLKIYFTWCQVFQDTTKIICLCQYCSLHKKLQVPSHKSYMQRRAPQRACLLALRRNAAISPRSRVQLIACEVPRCALSRVSPLCFPCCNTLHPIFSAYLPHLVRCPTQSAYLVHVYIKTAAWGMAKDGKPCGASEEVRQICARDQVRSVTTQETGQDTSAQIAIWTS